MNAVGFARYEQAGVTFDPELHRYTYFGHPVVNTTSVLRAHKISADWSQVPSETLDRKRAIGLAAHAATHYFDEGDLHPGTVADEVTPYLDAWRRFVEDQEFEPYLLETTLVHPIRRYGGTVDRWGVVHRLNPSGLPSIVDIKTGDPDDAGAGPQTAAYEQLVRSVLPELHAFLSLRGTDFATTLREMVEEPWMRYSVHLRPDGRYFVHTYQSYDDLKRFNWALALEASAHPSWRR